MSQSEASELAAAGIRHYRLDSSTGIDWQRSRDRMYAETNAFRAAQQKETSRRLEEANKKRREAEQQELVKAQEQEAAANRERRLRAEADQRAKQVAATERAQRLRSGEIKVASFEDAITFHDPVNLLAAVMTQPLLKADNAMYAGPVIVDAKESDDVLRVKLNLERGSSKYAFIRLHGKTVQYKTERMRLNGAVGVVGRYIGNQSYRTVDGQTKSAPVLEAAYIGTE